MACSCDAPVILCSCALGAPCNTSNSSSSYIQAAQWLGCFVIVLSSVCHCFSALLPSTSLVLCVTGCITDPCCERPECTQPQHVHPCQAMTADSLLPWSHHDRAGPQVSIRLLIAHKQLLDMLEVLTQSCHHSISVLQPEELCRRGVTYTVVNGLKIKVHRQSGCGHNWQITTVYYYIVYVFSTWDVIMRTMRFHTCVIVHVRSGHFTVYLHWL